MHRLRLDRVERRGDLRFQRTEYGRYTAYGSPFQLIVWLHHLSKANWSLSNLASMLRLNLFTYRDLTKWLADPMETPPLVPAAEQLTLALA